MAFVAQAADGSTIRYVDGKRYMWLASLTGPLVPIVGVALYFLSGGNPLACVFPLVYTFLFVPLADAIFGEDTHNPPEEVVPAMSRDNYYRVLVYVAIVLLFAQFFVVAWFIGTHSLPWWAFLALTLGCGFSSSASLLVGHELGHKASRTDRVAAQVVNGLVGYGHFCIEHNRGHHVHVATPEDSVSARMGESIYKFVLREIPGAFRRHRNRAAGDVRLDHGAVPADPSFLCLVRADAGELRRALRTAAPEAGERALRADGAAPFLEHEPHLFEPDLVPPAAPLGPSRQRAAAVSGVARFRQTAAPAQRLPGQLRPRGDPAAVVPGEGPEADAMGGWRYHQGERRSGEAREALREVRRARVGILRRCQNRLKALLSLAWHDCASEVRNEHDVARQHRR